MNADLTSRLAVLEELYDALGELIAPLATDSLNWEPTGPGSNTIADLTVHTVTSVNSWLARALAEEFARDRDSEFQMQQSAADLILRIERSRQLARAQFGRLASLDTATTRTVRRLSSGRDDTITIAWAIDHALIHAGEHWGQIQLIRDLLQQRPAA